MGADGSPSSYGRADARRHLMLKVFDVLYLNGEQVMVSQAPAPLDPVPVCWLLPLLLAFLLPLLLTALAPVQDWPYHERRKLLEEGACFLPLPHYVEVSEARRVDLSSPGPSPLLAALGLARTQGEEGVMVKAAAACYGPNVRSNVLKCKVEFIEGLGDTVTLRLVGVRQPRVLGGSGGDGSNGGSGGAIAIAEYVCGAYEDDSPSAPLLWLCNTSQLTWKDQLSPPSADALWRRYVTIQDRTRDLRASAAAVALLLTSRLGSLA